MGLDFIEIVMEAEDRFNVCIDWEDFERLPRQKQRDCTAGEFFLIVCAATRKCEHCKSPLTHQPPVEFCPECGEQFKMITWEAVRDLIGEQMSIEPGTIYKDSCLYQDLNVT